MQHMIDWCIGRHQGTNHFYDKYLPYEFHLKMVVQVFKDWQHLLPKNLFVWESTETPGYKLDETFEVIEVACWGHDVIENTRASYNDCIQHLGVNATEIVYALTNEKGRNRAERGSDSYYDGIRNTEGAVFCKLCDRIANIQYSILTKSRMFEMYKKENSSFLQKMDYTPDHELKSMFDYLINLFE